MMNCDCGGQFEFTGDAVFDMPVDPDEKFFLRLLCALCGDDNYIELFEYLSVKGDDKQLIQVFEEDETGNIVPQRSQCGVEPIPVFIPLQNLPEYKG